MLKKYRKNFVVFTMALIGAVLAAVFVFIGVYMYAQDQKELRSTMEQVLRPLDRPTGRFRPLDDSTGSLEEGEEPPKPDENGEKHSKNIRPPEADADVEIVTVFYTPDSDSISVQSDSFLDESTLADALSEIVSSSEDFGSLDSFGIIYLREGLGETYKIALADSSAQKAKFAKNAVALALIYLAAMGLLFIVSLRISKRAAKPMENAIEMERQFVADISHDLKTPIAVILANNSIIAKTPDATVASQSQWIESTNEAAHGMMELISEMLTLSALESGEKRAELYAVDLSAICDKTLLQLDSLAYDRKIEIASEIEEGVKVNATKEYAERIVSSLVENALKYESDGGRIEVKLRASKKRAALTVRNISSFIDEADAEHIFERFYRADRSRSEKSGHGLGLPIVKSITELIGAGISVKSSKEDGTTFTVDFPLAES